MKNLSFCLLLMLAMGLSNTSQAQIEVPRPSPLGSVMQTIGFAEATFTYSRPGVKGRTIFGDLVPYDKIWRTGANAATRLELSKDVTIEGKQVPAGIYSVFTKPGKEKWMIYLNKDLTASASSFDPAKNQAEFSVRSATLPNKVETFTITFTEVTDSSSVVELAWENTAARFTIVNAVDAVVMASIDKFMKGVDPMGYYQAANYYYSTGRDNKIALEYMNKAVAGMEKPTYWMLHRKALIQAETGDYKGAMETANKSMALAKEAGNEDYISLNSKVLEEWKVKAKGK